MRAENLRFVATPELLTILFNKEFQANTRLKPYKVVHGKTRILYIAEVGVGDTDWMEVTDLPAGITAYSPLFAFPSSGCALKSQNFSARREINSIDDLVLALNHAGFVAGDILLKPGDAAEYLQQQVFAYGSDASSLRVFDVKGGASPGLSEYKVIFPPVQNTRLPLEHEKLAKIRFGIVGLGSLGSKIAISLGRSGARQFLLVDDDFLTPGNVCRNELTWMSVGVHKVQAVKDTLTLIAPGMAIDIRMHRVAGQESTLEAAKTLRDLAACDVLIDATAIPDVFLLLASVARKNLKPLCWGELFAGGYGGIIARARPDLDPNPLAVRSALTDYFSKLPPAPYQNAGGYDVEQTQPLLAYDSDVGQIAAPLTRLAIDTALQNNPSQFPHPAYLIGLRKDWDFSEPFDVRPIDAIGAGWTEMTTPVDKDVLLSVTQELLKIIESSNDKPDPS
jgi:hypothetical protein